MYIQNIGCHMVDTAQYHKVEAILNAKNKFKKMKKRKKEKI